MLKNPNTLLSSDEWIDGRVVDETGACSIKTIFNVKIELSHKFDKRNAKMSKRLLIV